WAWGRFGGCWLRCRAASWNSPMQWLATTTDAGVSTSWRCTSAISASSCSDDTPVPAAPLSGSAGCSPPGVQIVPMDCYPTWAIEQESGACPRSEEHTSELQSPCNLVCRLLLEKKKKKLKLNIEV